MVRIVVCALALAFFSTIVQTLPAEAENRRPIPRPPAVLSPDQPRFLQIKPHQTKRSVSSSSRSVSATRDRSRGFFNFKKAEKKSRPRGVARQYLPQIVRYTGRETPGTILIDTDARFLYLILSDGKAKRYGVGVGRQGFEWAGTHTVTRKAEWPAWTPPPEMIAREAERGRILPAMMEGGPNNPLGARALYLGDTLYRIHGSNEPWTIGHAVSSGCIRMRNEDVTDLYARVGTGTRVIVR